MNGVGLFSGWLLPLLWLTPAVAHAQTASQSPADPQQREHVEQQLRELRAMKQDLQQTMQDMLRNMESMRLQVQDFDARIRALEAEAPSIAPRPEDQVAGDDSGAARPGTPEAEARAAETETIETLEQPATEETWGPYERGKGFVLARTPVGELGLGVYGYLRYLNEGALRDTYTDAFGRDFVLDLRQDFQINRLQLNFRSWLFTERFAQAWWVWTQNVTMGEETQINVGGFLSYRFADEFILRGGIFALPTTRSTYQSFPNWLRIDNRTMADEFFRGSYTTGLMASGEIAHGFFYKAALGNNLSLLGVNANELDFGLSTVSTAIWWAPTTGEFGPGFGFGDYEYHTELATLFGLHFTRSRENAQGQPDENDFENSQIRLSDGTLIFSPDPFGTGGNVEELTYRMLDLNAGFKYRGWSLEGEYYFRWLDDFDVIGTIPVDDLYDHGFQVQASTMLKRDYVQLYVSGSKIFGEFGDPWDVGIGLTVFPFGYKAMRMNAQALFMDRSAVGELATPYVVGGDGWVFTVDIGVWY